MEHVTLVPVDLLAVVVLGNLHTSLKPNKRHLQPHSKPGVLEHATFLVKFSEDRNNSYKNQYCPKMESVVIKLD
jgi:hypothetical protein